MRNSVLVTVVAAVIAVVVVVCGILSGVSEVSSRMEMADRADAMEYVGVDTSYYAYCEAVDRADSLRVKYEFTDSVYFHVIDSLMNLGYDLTLADYKDIYVPIWKLHMTADKEYRNAKYAVKRLEKTWLKAQEKYDAEITKLRNQSEDYSVLIFGACVYIVVLFIFYLFISMMVQEMRYDEKEALERDAWKNRTNLTCPVWILENGDVTIKKVRVVLNKYCTERDMYENYVESCADFHVSKDMCMTFEQWLSCCE